MNQEDKPEFLFATARSVMILSMATLALVSSATNDFLFQVKGHH